MAKNKRAFITGISGQDGSYLAELLLEKGYEVHGLIRPSSAPVQFARSRLEGVRKKIHYHYGDVVDAFSLLWALKKIRPHEVYHLAAQSHVKIAWEVPWYTAQTTGVGVLNLLESIRVLGLKCKIYNASTSELFSGKEKMQDENTKKDPVSPYGTAKLYGFQIAKNYREAFGMFVANGILFNHESARRGDNFVTKKIVNAVKNGYVKLGNVHARRDWGYAPEYVEAMWRMLQQKKPDDFVIATGETHSVKQFVSWVQQVSCKDIKIVYDKEYMRPSDVDNLRGIPTKAHKKLGWKAKVKKQELVRKMLHGS